MILFIVCVLALYLISFFPTDTISISKDKTTALKAIMAVLIVFHHLSLQGISFLQTFHSWGAPIVSLFLFLSGYGLIKSLCTKGEAYLSNFFVHRIIKGIVIPFLIAWAIYRLLNIMSLPNIFKELEALIYNGTTILPHSWFIFAILYFYVSFYISYKYFNNKVRFLVLIVLIILFELWCQYWNYDRCWYISAFGFPTGILIGQYENKIIKYLKGSIRYYSVIPISLSITALCVYAKIEIAYMLVYILIPIMFATLLFKVKLENLIRFKIIRYLSSISFEIYLSQGISMCLLRGPFLNLESDYLYVTLTLVLTVVIATFIKQIRQSVLHYCFNS